MLSIPAYNTPCFIADVRPRIIAVPATQRFPNSADNACVAAAPLDVRIVWFSVAVEERTLACCGGFCCQDSEKIEGDNSKSHKVQEVPFSVECELFTEVPGVNVPTSRGALRFVLPRLVVESSHPMYDPLCWSLINLLWLV